jgi:hypothetical protein
VQFGAMATMKCPKCNGFVTDHYDDQVCVNCGWRDLPADIAKPILTLSAAIGVNRVQINLDPANSAHKKRMEKMLTKCEGSGKAGYEYTNRRSIGKARCRVCDQRVLATDTTVVKDHKPTRLMLEQLNYALAINKQKPNQPPFSLSL